MNDDELELALAQALTPADAEPPEDRVAALREQAERARRDQPDAPQGAELRSVDTGAPAPSRRERPKNIGTGTRWWTAAGVAAAVAVGVGIGTAVDLSGESTDEVLARGVPEFEATLGSEGAEVDVEGSAAPEGRIVRLRSESLPDLPIGEYYELWFLAPGDSPDSPDRISAGTFHPAYDGSGTDVVLHAAVDPELYPMIEITRELPDGDPSPSGDVVLSGSATLLEQDGR